MKLIEIWGKPKRLNEERFLTAQVLSSKDTLTRPILEALKCGPASAFEILLECRLKNPDGSLVAEEGIEVRLDNLSRMGFTQPDTSRQDCLPSYTMTPYGNLALKRFKKR